MNVTTAFFFFVLLVFFSFQLGNCFEFFRDSHDRCLGSKMHSCVQHALKNIYGGKLFMLLSATLSIYCPNPSLSLGSALRHTAKASWNIWMKGGRIRGRERERRKIKKKNHCSTVRIWPYCFRGHRAFPFSTAAGLFSLLRLHV